MTNLYLYNSLSQQKQPFKPIDHKHIRLYVCGPTVYDDAHIGNARPVVVFDILFRMLRQIYGEQAVIYVRNITDVDDKINLRARRDYPDLPINQAIKVLTDKVIDQFHQDIAALGCLPPSVEPRATDYIDKMRQLIDRLVGDGYAYVSQDHVLFSVSQMNQKAKIPYGTLSKRDLNEMLPGARVEVADYKRDKMDFVLWKPSTADEPAWDSPAGIETKGRPGWHIECSAMSLAQLIEPFGGGLDCCDAHKNSFDIHGGGLDLIFPHHENEIAQSCCALNGDVMANYWLHNGFVQVEGRKMSKSLGNFITVSQILSQDFIQFSDNVSTKQRRQWAGMSIRLSFLQTHYHEPLNWTQKRLTESAQELYRWYKLLRTTEFDYRQTDEAALQVVMDILADNLNFSQVITQLRIWYREENSLSLWPGLRFMGLNLDELLLQADHPIFIKSLALSEEEIESKIAERLEYLKQKEWGKADCIRDELLNYGIILQDINNPHNGLRETQWYQKDL